EGISQEESNQKLLMLRTVAEVGAQAIQRAMLVTKNIRAQRLAAVSKTAIAANHEINSPLTTILLKLDMIVKEASVNKSVIGSLQEIKNEAIKIKSIVKKMLEITDVVETSYIKDEKMLDLHNGSGAQNAASPPLQDARPEPAGPEGRAGLDDYVPEKNGRQTSAEKDRTMLSDGATPGFEDYMEQQTDELSKKISQVSGTPLASDTPGFEDYLE
ncbi:MAG: hypothetical protein WDA72_11335, partial [Desulfomonilia bacterium]